jgi:hypothetical protein
MQHDQHPSKQGKQLSERPCDNCRIWFVLPNLRHEFSFRAANLLFSQNILTL